MSQCAYTSIAACGILYVLLALRMSFFRLAGSPGENKINSPLNRWYEVQMLTAEWTPIGIGLGLALLHKGTAPVEWVEWLLGAFCTARYIFALSRIWFTFFPGSVVSMVTCYVSTAAMCALLIAY